MNGIELQGLTNKQKARLRNLEQEIGIDQITTSFFIEGRDSSGRKKSTFYSARSIRRQVDDQTNHGFWDLDEIKPISCILSKHVVMTTFRDAVKKGIMTGHEASREAEAICNSYDKNLANLV